MVLVIVAYILFFSTRTDDSSLLTSQNNTNNVVDRELLTSLLELRSLTLDEAVFSREDFRNLKDISIDIAPQPIGRNNPFSPLGSDTPFVPQEVSQSTTTPDLNEVVE